MATDRFRTAVMEFEDARENEAVAQKALEANTDCDEFIGYGGAACDALDNWNKATQRVSGYLECIRYNWLGF